MKKVRSTFFCLLLLISTIGTAQVGIGTTEPKALLDVPASSTSAPSNTDGILIPRIDAFPAINPTANQIGMMVYVTGNGTDAEGFYYWNGIDWNTVCTATLNNNDTKFLVFRISEYFSTNNNWLCMDNNALVSDALVGDWKIIGYNTAVSVCQFWNSATTVEVTLDVVKNDDNTVLGSLVFDVSEPSSIAQVLDTPIAVTDGTSLRINTNQLQFDTGGGNVGGGNGTNLFLTFILTK